MLHPCNSGSLLQYKLIGAVELVRDRRTLEPLSEDMDEIEQLGEVFRDFCLSHGIIIRPIFSTIMMTPPLTISELEIDFLIEKLILALDDFSAYLEEKCL